MPVAHAAVDRPAIEIVNRFRVDRSASFLREKGRLSGLATCDGLVKGRIAEGLTQIRHEIGNLRHRVISNKHIQSRLL
ncbi:hypothetical protein CR51_36120 [Caballeronia megalochromosomata]|nr:hypothetical protein CR51_36120 [Caballeronia megalochromosomata]